MEKTEGELPIPTYYGEAVVLMGIPDSRKSIIPTIVSGSLDDLSVYRSKKGNYFVMDKIPMKVNASSYLVPQKITDFKTGTVLLDLPVFKQNRSSKEDTTVKYLTRKVCSNLKSFSLVLVVTEDSLKPKAKFGYASLVNAVADMMNHTDSLQDSFGLIVTNVVNKGWKSKIRSDQTIFTTIKSRLRNFIADEREKQREQKKSNNSSSNLNQKHVQANKIKTGGNKFDVDLSMRKITLTNILLKDNKIVILREPDKCGKFGKSTYAKRNQISIVKLMTSELNKTTTNNTVHFRYSPLTKSSANIELISQDLNSQVESQVRRFLKKISDVQYRGDLMMHLDFFSARQQQKEEVGNFSLFSKLFNSSSPKLLGKSLHQIMQNTTYDQTSVRNLQNELNNLEWKMSFFESFIFPGKSLRLQKVWMTPLVNWIDQELIPRMETFTFIKDLRIFLSTHQFHKEKKPDIDLTKISINGITKLSDKGNVKMLPSVKTFLETGKDHFTEHILNQIIQEAFYEPEINCTSDNPPILYAKGTFVTTALLINTTSHSALECRNRNTSKIIILASRRIFLDAHLNFSRYGKNFYTLKEIALVSPEIIVKTEANATFPHIFVPGGDGRPGNVNEDEWPKEEDNQYLLLAEPRKLKLENPTRQLAKLKHGSLSPTLNRSKRIKRDHYSIRRTMGHRTCRQPRNE